MKVRYIGKTVELCLTNGKIYEALGYEHGFIRVIDDSDEDYLFEPENFEVIDEN